MISLANKDETDGCSLGTNTCKLWQTGAMAGAEDYVGGAMLEIDYVQGRVLKF